MTAGRVGREGMSVAFCGHAEETDDAGVGSSRKETVSARSMLSATPAETMRIAYEDRVNKTTIVLADSHRVVMEGIKSALGQDGLLAVIGEACTGREVLRVAKSVRPDIIIMDVPLPDLLGILPVQKLRASVPESRIIIFTMRERKEYLPHLVKAGIHGYIQKDAELSELIGAIHAVADGKMYFSVKPTSVPPCSVGAATNREGTAGRSERLTPREREIFRCIADGRAIAEIAGMLGRSPKTVESQKYRIMEKLHAQTVSDLVRIAVKRKIVRL